MTNWTPPTFVPGVAWQDFPSRATPVDAADLNLEANSEASYAALVGTNLANYFEDGQSPSVPTAQVLSPGNLGSAYTIDFQNHAVASVVLVGTLNANCTITLVNRAQGCRAVLLLLQDATGNRTLNVSDGTNSTAISVNPTASSLASLEVDCPNATDLYVSILGSGGLPSSVVDVSSASAMQVAVANGSGGYNFGVLGSVYDAVLDGGIVPSTPTSPVDQAAAINTWLLSLPEGSIAFFPWIAGGLSASSGGSFTQYFVSTAVEIPRNITVQMPDAHRVMFSAMSSFSDTQIVRNWRSSDGTGFNPPNTTAKPSYYPKLINVGIDFNGISSVTGLGLVHPQERSILRDINFYGSCSAGVSGSGTGNTCIAVFANGDTAGAIAGRVTFRHMNFYIQSCAHFIYVDGTNNGTTTNWGKDIEFLEWTSPSTPPTGTGSFSDSPIYIKAIDGLYLDGHQECMAPNGVSDTAGIRLIDVSRAKIRVRYSPSNALQRPFVRATSTGSAPSQYPIGPPHLVDCDLFRVTGGPGFAYRNDASCGLNGTTTVTDTAILSTDLYRPVYGPGVPSGTTITSVTAGTSFVMSNAAEITATVTLKIGCNVIEDETVSGVTRWFQWDDTYFAPQMILNYIGPEIRWLNGLPGGTQKIQVARSLYGDAARAALAPSNAISESWLFGRGQPGGVANTSAITSQTLLLTHLPLYPGDKVSNLSWYASSTGLSGASNQWAALFDPSRNQIAISADGTSGTWSASTEKTFAMTTAYTASLPAIHYAGLLINATGVPTLVASSNGVVDTQTPALHGNSTASLTTPSSCPTTAGSITASNNTPYVLAT